MSQKTIAIDFDGVIHNYANPIEGRRMGAPYPEAIPAIRDLKHYGYTIVVHTVRATTQEGSKVVRDWLDYYQVPYSEVTALKPNADYYIDDKAVRHTDWGTTLQFIRLDRHKHK